MHLYSDQAGYDDHTVEQIGRMVEFLVLLYVPHWIMATRAADAPLLDLQLTHDLIRYKRVDGEVAEAVLGKLSNHGWYLTPEIVPFVLFSEHADATGTLKDTVAAELVKTAKPASYEKGRPVFPIVTENTSLANLITPQSHLLFALLKISSDWLQEPHQLWDLNADYCKAKKIIRELKVTNDVAERGVKMMADFAQHLTCDPTQRQNLVQVVEYHRRRFPNFKKKELNGCLEFI